MNLWRWALAAAIAAHGIAHVPGFAVSWRLMTSPEIPFHTALFGGRLVVSEGTIKALGVLWLAAGAAFVGTAVLLAVRSPYAAGALAVVTLASLLLCVLEWPYARIGVFVNVAILMMMPVAAALLWQSETRAATALIESASRGAPPRVPRSATPLPAPVERYFARSITPGAAPIRVAHLEQDAEFFVGGAWRPLRATQTFTVAPAGFVWDARIRMLPGVSVFVRDSYRQGGGAMRADFMGLYPITDQSGVAELNAGALHRYLAEAIWLPSALRPDAGVVWTPLTDSSALATLQDGATHVSLEFRFNTDGDVVEVFTPERFAETNGSYVRRPWLVRCADHEVRHGYRIPLTCAVEWQLPTGPQPYWRGRISAIRYELEPAAPSAPLSSE